MDRAIAAAEARHVTASLVQGLALRALVERSRGELGRAAASIAQALEVAEPGRFTRTFVDLGPPLTGCSTSWRATAACRWEASGCSTRAARSPL